MTGESEPLFEALLAVTQSILGAERGQEALEAIAQGVSRAFGFRYVSIVAAESPESDMMRRVMLGWSEESKAERLGEIVSRSATREFLSPEFEVYPHCYYFPAERFVEWRHALYSGENEGGIERSAPNRWHERDSIALVLADASDRMFGYISIDGPEDGAVPNRATLTRMRVFADLVGLALANVRARIAEAARRELLESRARSQSEFLGIVAHELRSPLAAIRGAAILLETNFERLAEPRRRELLQAISASTTRMSTLFDDFLLLSRVDAGSLALQDETVDPRLIVNEALGRMRSEHPSRRFSARTPDEIPYVRGDETRIVQVLCNVLSNAVRYSPAGTKIGVSLQTVRSYVRFSVRNRGPGIPHEDRERLFTRFGQVGKHPDGTGLGLYLSRQLVELMGGQIDFESTPNDVTTFWFSLPIAVKA
uniref:histidine kinase n=1 Tax=mine drainage metagenome TaxID=410659 RepID=E6Q823_9ZZZZ